MDTGSPCLHKDIEYITEKLSKVSNVEVVTNGDALNHQKCSEKLYDAKAA